ATWLPQRWFHFVSILDKQLEMCCQFHASFCQISRRSLSQFVFLLPVFLWCAFVHLPPYNSRVAGLSRKSTSPAHPYPYISSYSIKSYPVRPYRLVCF